MAQSSQGNMKKMAGWAGQYLRQWWQPSMLRFGSDPDSTLRSGVKQFCLLTYHTKAEPADAGRTRTGCRDKTIQYLPDRFILLLLIKNIGKTDPHNCSRPNHWKRPGIWSPMVGECHPESGSAHRLPRPFLLCTEDDIFFFEHRIHCCLADLYWHLARRLNFRRTHHWATRIRSIGKQ